MNVCPSCGYCPHCGHKPTPGITITPQQPWPAQPYIGDPPGGWHPTISSTYKNASNQSGGSW